MIAHLKRRGDAYRARLTPSYVANLLLPWSKSRTTSMDRDQPRFLCGVRFIFEIISFRLQWSKPPSLSMKCLWCLWRWCWRRP